MNSNLSQFKLLEGQVIDGKYRLIKLLGVGGFGAVFRADEVVRDRVLRQVAVKVIPPADTLEAQAKQLNELQAARNLDHPHIIRCFAAGEFSDDSNQTDNVVFLYLVMELADYSLDSHLENGVLSDQPLYQMIAQVAEALNYLHTEDLVHQDLKPGNVLWVKNVWKVSDFGTVRHLDARSHVQTVHIAGTPLYMSPEAFLGTVSSAWDMWSLGMMTVVAATGDIPVALSKNSLLPELNALVQGCLKPDWRQRWKAQQVLDAIVAIQCSAPSVPATQPQPQASAQRIQPIAPNTAPTVPVNLRPSPSPQQSDPKPASPIVLPQQKAPKPLSSVAPHPFVPEQNTPARLPLISRLLRLFLASTFHKNYQELLPGKVPLAMIAIPAGSFLMGSPDGEGRDNEHPQHRVSVPQFYMGKYPITNAQWRSVMQSDPCTKSDEKFRGDRQPVISVSWNDAQAFCQKLTQLTRRNYRLPSEAEWEYACRVGSQTTYSFGDNASQLKNYAWYHGNSNGQTHPVGETKPNAFGLYDMYGNVWEWCQDRWHKDYNDAPTDGSAWVDVENDRQERKRVLRGSSWLNFPENCRSASRNFDIVLNRHDFIGFRVVCGSP